MTDLKIMMDSIPLHQCKEEIDNQFNAIVEDKNEMKKAILLSFFLQRVLHDAQQVDGNKFVTDLRNHLQGIIQKTEQWKQNLNWYMEHMEKNQELLTAFEQHAPEVQNLEKKLQQLLTDYDNTLKQLGRERCQKSIAEIEAELTTAK